MAVPNVFYPADFLGQLLARNGSRPQYSSAIAFMPKHFLPRHVHRLSGKEQALRAHFWGSAMILEAGIVVAVGTLVMYKFVRMKGEWLAAQLAQEDVDHVWQIGDRVYIPGFYNELPGDKGTVKSIKTEKRWWQQKHGSTSVAEVWIDKHSARGPPNLYFEHDDVHEDESGWTVTFVPPKGTFHYIGRCPVFAVRRLRKQALFIFAMHFAISTSLTVTAALTKELSPTTGLPWEGYFLMFSLGNLWCLLQAVWIYLFKVEKRTEYPINVFVLGWLATVVPFASDAVDTFKDIQFGALCLRPDTAWQVKVVGLFSVAYVFAFHIWLLCGEGSLSELAGTYLAISITATTNENKLKEETLMPLYVMAYQQTTLEKRYLLTIENVPQVACLAIYMWFEGPRLLVLISAIAMPCIQYLFAWVAHDRLKRKTVVNAVNVLRKLVDEHNFVKLGKVKKAFFDDGALLMRLAMEDDYMKNSLRDAIRKLKNDGDDDWDVISNFLQSVTVIQDGKISPRASETLAEVLKVNRTTTEIILRVNGLGNDGVAHIAAGLKVNTTITTVELDRSCDGDLGTQGADSIADALKFNTSITNVALRHVRIVKEGIASVADALKVNTAITRIELRGCGLHANAVCIADVLKVNTKIATIHLDGNALDDKDAGSIADGLKCNTAITHISLHVNKIGKEGAAYIADALKVNTTIITMTLYRNSLGKEGATSIADALKFNKSIASIELDSNDAELCRGTRIALHRHQRYADFRDFM